MSPSKLADACTVLALLNIGALALLGMPLPAATLAGVSLAAFSGGVRSSWSLQAGRRLATGRTAPRREVRDDHLGPLFNMGYS